MKTGTVTTVTGPPASGKTYRATKWAKESPDKRRVVEGDPKEAQRLAKLGFDVTLNMNH